MWIDSHCHLNHERNAERPETLVPRAREAGVESMITICCQIASEFPDVLNIAKNQPGVWCSIGTHPHDSGLAEEKAITLDRLCQLAQSHPKIVGIGESGLDYYYNRSPQDEQQESFRKHIRACMQTDLPLIVHARDADEDIIRIMKEEGSGRGLKGVMHCFSSGPWLAEKALELGFYLSFSGIVTFKKSGELRAIAKNTPADRILIETDAPYLAPEPHRGHTNEPAYVVHTGKFLAELRETPEFDFANQVRKNFYTLFDKAA